MVFRSPKRRLGPFFASIAEAGQNAQRTAELFDHMLETWPDEQESLTREILKAEQEGDRITHEIIRKLNERRVNPVDHQDLYMLATKIDDVVDYIEEATDLLNLYQIEAPMSQALDLSKVLKSACDELGHATAELADLGDLEERWIEIHRLENDGDRISRDAVASLFANGIDPMVVIRWKDIFATLEGAIDSTEAVAHVIEGIVIKNS